MNPWVILGDIIGWVVLVLVSLVAVGLGGVIVTIAVITARFQLADMRAQTQRRQAVDDADDEAAA